MLLEPLYRNKEFSSKGLFKMSLVRFIVTGGDVRAGVNCSYIFKTVLFINARMN